MLVLKEVTDFDNSYSLHMLFQIFDPWNDTDCWLVWTIFEENEILKIMYFILRCHSNEDL